MAGILGQLRDVVHKTSAALIDRQITTKLSDMLTASVKTGFEIVKDVLTILKDLTKAKP